MASVTRCDGCGQERPSTERDGWLRLHQTTGPMNILRGETGFLDCGDFCSWKCVADVASLHALDPTPPAIS